MRRIWRLLFLNKKIIVHDFDQIFPKLQFWWSLTALRLPIFVKNVTFRLGWFIKYFHWETFHWIKNNYRLNISNAFWTDSAADSKKKLNEFSSDSDDFSSFHQTRLLICQIWKMKFYQTRLMIIENTKIFVTFLWVRLMIPKSFNWILSDWTEDFWTVSIDFSLN